MKLQDSLKKHENDKPQFRNNKWFSDTGTIFCIRNVDIEDDPFRPNELRWTMSALFLDPETHKTNTGHITFKHDGGRSKWDKIFGDMDPNELPDHNWQLMYNVPGNPQKGYNLVQTGEDASTCPCSKRLAWKQQPEDSVDEILDGMGFMAPLATDGQKHAMEILSEALRVALPDDMEHLTNAQAETWLAAAKKQHVGVGV